MIGGAVMIAIGDGFCPDRETQGNQIRYAGNCSRMDAGTNRQPPEVGEILLT